MNTDTRPFMVPLQNLLTAAGFFPMTEFSAVDSLAHPDDMLAVICPEGTCVTGCAYDISNMQLYAQTDVQIKLRLYGKSGDFVDYDTFSAACEELFYALAASRDLLICKMKASKTIQSMPLKRLERDIDLVLRINVSKEVPDDR